MFINRLQLGLGRLLRSLPCSHCGCGCDDSCGYSSCSCCGWDSCCDDSYDRSFFPSSRCYCNCDFDCDDSYNHSLSNVTWLPASSA